ncbi:MAG: Thoeris anti-defense Tad2 family protein, partial [Pseudonocardiaceae bacterium]
GRLDRLGGVPMSADAAAAGHPPTGRTPSEQRRRTHRKPVTAGKQRVTLPGMDFSAALELMKNEGRRMARRSWIQSGKYVYLEPESVCVSPDNQSRTLEAHLRFVTAAGTVQAGVQPSHAGLLAEDWYDIDAETQR